MTTTPGAGTPSTTAPTTATIIGGNATTPPLETDYTVPAGVFSVRVDCWGQIGTSLSGVNPGYQSGIFNVSPGDTLYANIPDDNGNGGVTNTSGGSGAENGQPGGCSADIRQGSNDITSRMVVAGGGGGAGGYGSYSTGAEPMGGNGSVGGSPSYTAAGTGQNNDNNTAAGGVGAVGATPGTAGTNSSASTAAQPGSGNLPSKNRGGNGGNGPQTAGWPGGGGGGGGGGYTGGAGGGGGGGDAGSVANSSGAGGGGGAGGTSWSSPLCTGVRSLAGATMSSGGIWNLGMGIMITPNPPVSTIVTPVTSSVVDCNAGFSIVYNYFSASGVASQYHILRRRVLSGTTYQYWSGSAWVSTEQLRPDTTASGAQGTINLAATDFPNGASWEISVCNLDADYAVGAYCTPVIIKAQTAPVVSITIPATTQEATMSWTETLAANATQVSYRAMVYTAAVAATSGFVFGQYATNAGVPTVPQIDTLVVYGQETSWTAPDDNGNGAQPFMLLASSGYVMGVQVTQTSGQTQVGTSSTGYTYASFTTPASGLTAPGITVTPSAPGLPPTVVITLTGATGAPWNVQRSMDGGNTWTPLRQALIGTYSGPITDYEICPNTPTMYRAAIRNTALTLQSTFTVSPEVTVAPFNFWLSNPLIPGSAIPVSQQPGVFTEATGERQAVYNLLGNEYPVVLADTIQASGLTALQFVFLTDAAYQAFEALRQSQATLLLQAATWPQQWYVRLGASWTVTVNQQAARQLGQPVRLVSGSAQAVATP